MEPDPERLSAAVTAAVEARGSTYAPYSGFEAGAAVLGEDGEILTGAIVENISLGLAMCAERVALFSAVTSGHRPVALVLSAPNTGPDVTWPCGACRQVALELGGPDVLIAAVGPDGPVGDAVGAVDWRPLHELLVDAPHRRRR